MHGLSPSNYKTRTVIDEKNEMRHHLLSLRREMRMLAEYMFELCPILKWSIVHIRYQLLPFFFFIFFLFFLARYNSGSQRLYVPLWWICSQMRSCRVHELLYAMVNHNTGGWNQNAGTFLYIRLVPKISWRCKTGSSTFVTLTSVNTLWDLFYSETRKYGMHCLKFTGK